MCSLLVATVGVTFTQVVFRYLLHISLAWTEELARYFFIWLVMLGAAYGFKKKSHFALVFVVNRLNQRLQKVISTLVMLAVSIFLILIVFEALRLIFYVTISQTGPCTRISMAFPHFSVPIGCTLMLYYLLRSWWSEFRKPDRTSEDR